LIVIVSGGPSTRNLIDAQVIGALGPDGVLVNISRGSVVDEEALIAALSTGGLAAAGLDVFASEPAPDPRLLALANVTLMPHHASGTVESRDAMDQQVVDNLAAHFAGKPLLSAII
jgi:lactate dehydrogenase-like 2-hydroxyacid dehydrogenase